MKHDPVMGPGNRQPEEHDHLACRIPVSRVIPPCTHIHIESIGHAEPFYFFHEIIKLHHPAGIYDAQIPVQLGQRPVTARPGPVNPHSDFFGEI